MGNSLAKHNTIIMKSFALILCFSVAATVASPVGTEDCSDCVNHTESDTESVTESATDCKTVKKIKYVEEFETKCHIESHEECTYETVFEEKCVTKEEACEKFWKEDGYGGKIWMESPSSCHWLQED